MEKKKQWKIPKPENFKKAYLTEDDDGDIFLVISLHNNFFPAQKSCTINGITLK